MHEILAAYGVRVVALSKDSVAQAALQKERDGLRTTTLLADPELAVIGQYGLIHHKALEFKSWTVLGIPLGVPVGSKRMAIPTTLLVDEASKVRWIDQAEDYRLRGDEVRIRHALKEAFGALEEE